MRRDAVCLVAGAEPTEIDQAVDVGGARGRREVLCRPAVTLLEIAARPHRVDQIVRRIDIRECRLEASLIQQVTLEDVDIVGRRVVAGAVPDEYAHLVAGIEERGDESVSHEPRRAGD